MSGSVAVPIVRIDGHDRTAKDDHLAVEEPLEIRLSYGTGRERTSKSLSITMRTPGDDVALALGFLVSEGIVRSAAEVEEAKHCGPAARDDGTSNIVRVTLGPGARFDLARLERHFYTTSSCGICGKTSLEAVRSAAHTPLVKGLPRVTPELIHQLPGRLREAQLTFSRTGGLHGAALFDASGALLCVREDVGRHNAVDKVIGDQLRAGQLPLESHILLVSGRASFELAQKAVMAGIGVLAAVGAPSSLAVELAREESMTILGFVRDGRFNVYSGEDRVLGIAAS
ncbi:MAG: Protein fdhD [Labilithrix sp.]|nr:Protein fdhD [Labilithrix sp.]